MSRPQRDCPLAWSAHRRRIGKPGPPVCDVRNRVIGKPWEDHPELSVEQRVIGRPTDTQIWTGQNMSTRDDILATEDK